MDALTHTLAAAALWRSRLLPREAGAWGGLALLLASNAADAEAVIQIGSTAAYIRNYHGAAHSLLGGVLIATAIAALGTWGLRRAGRTGMFPALFALTLAGAGSHLLLDCFHGYGARLFWPASQARYVLPLLAGHDVANLAVLLIALGIPLLLNVVNAEIGAPRVQPARFAIAGLIGVALLLPVRFYLRSRADSAASTVLAVDAESHSLHPSPFLPWRWYLIEDTPVSYLAQEVDGAGPRVLPGMTRFLKPAPNNALIAARDTDAARQYLDLALYPLFSLGQGRKGVLVRIRDMKFYVPGAGERAYSLEIEINSQLRVLSEHVYF